ncbi:hypothetical protein GQ42DRAFT_177821 [Ramicandelaber brevisporus]|nr:hypothetical protein GQ42DRAFT_177821 [Ramicandelaber brevisporus]
MALPFPYVPDIEALVCYNGPQDKKKQAVNNTAQLIYKHFYKFRQDPAVPKRYRDFIQADSHLMTTETPAFLPRTNAATKAYFNISTPIINYNDAINSLIDNDVLQAAVEGTPNYYITDDVPQQKLHDPNFDIFSVIRHKFKEAADSQTTGSSNTANDNTEVRSRANESLCNWCTVRKVRHTLSNPVRFQSVHDKLGVSARRLQHASPKYLRKHRIITPPQRTQIYRYLGENVEFGTRAHDLAATNHEAASQTANGCAPSANLLGMFVGVVFYGTELLSLTPSSLITNPTASFNSYGVRKVTFNSLPKLRGLCQKFEKYNFVELLEIDSSYWGPHKLANPGYLNAVRASGAHTLEEMQLVKALH